MLAKCKSKVSLLPVCWSLLVKDFLCRHTSLTTLVVAGSEQFFGKIIFAALCTIIPGNIIFVRTALLPDKAPALKLVMATAFLAEAAIVAGIFLPLSYYQKKVHAPKEFIPRLLLMLGEGGGGGRSQRHPWLTTKLKYEDLYGRLTSGPKLGFSMGSLGECITYFSSFQVNLLSLFTKFCLKLNSFQLY